MKETDYLELEFARSFRAFARQREELLKVLEALPRKDWSRSAIVKGAGEPMERDILFYAEWLGVDERPHIKQIARSLQLTAERGDTG